MEKKSNKGLIVTIVILAVLLVGVSGYLVYDKVFTEKEIKEDSNETEDKQESDNKEQEELENNDKKDDTLEEKGEAVSEKEKAKLLNVINDINNYNLGKYDNLNPSDISNQEKLAFVSWIVREKQLKGENGNIVGLKGSEVNDIYKKYFGSNESVINEDVFDYNKEIIFGYDKNKDTYVSKNNSDYTVVPVERTSSYSFILDATKKADVYTVKVHSVYESICLDVCADVLLAGSYEEAVNDLFFTGDIFIATDKNGNVRLATERGYMEQEEIDAIHKGYNDRLPVYTYTFVLENGNYVLKNKTIEKKWVMAK